MINLTGKFTKNRLTYLSNKTITIQEIKKRKLESLRDSGNFAENPQGDQ